MIEDVFLEDLRSRGVEVIRSCPFVKCSVTGPNSYVETTCKNAITERTRKIRSKYVVGCDGAHSQVRRSIPSVSMVGESGKAAWGVLDGSSLLSAVLLRAAT
jgi:phenol 2-monooxygenase (NADPH)